MFAGKCLSETDLTHAHVHQNDIKNDKNWGCDVPKLILNKP